MTLFPDSAEPATLDRPQLDETAATGPLSRLSYRYRGAVIDRQKGGYVCRLSMEAHPLHGPSFGVAGTITPLFDLWLDEGRLPRHMRAVPPTAR
jgi:hypothetical protein